jgi:predicted permease
MLNMFTEQLGEVRRNGGRLQQAALWLHAALDALTIAPQEHCHVILQDLRYALRIMSANPGFTAIAILSLALGIGANTAIFSLWNGVLHASLPGVLKPEQLVMLSNPDTAGMWHGNADGDRDWLTYAEFGQLRDHAGSFSGVMASESSLDGWQLRFKGGDWEEAHGRLVSGGYFEFLGVHPALGRAFTSADDLAEAPYAVISYNYWQRRFNGSPGVVGKTFTLRKAVLTIIGVAPAGFIGETVGQQPDLWLPLRMQPLVIPGDDRLHDTPPAKAMWLHVFGRLKSGVTAAQAEAEANVIFKAGLETFYGSVPPGESRREYMDQRLRIRPGARGASYTRHDFSNSLTALLAAVGVLLMIACANLANLLLARGATRKSEIALRLSLGASRGRLIRQLVTESLALAAFGGLAGLVLCWFLYGALVRMIADSDRNFHMGFALDPLVLAFALATTLAAALLFGVFPAWQVTRSDAGASLKEQSRSATGSLGRMRSGRLLVSLQLALSLPLLVSAGLLVRTIYNLQHVELGFPAERLLLVRIDSREAGYDAARRNKLLSELRANFRRIPGVRAASFSSLGLFSGGNSVSGIEVEGYQPKADSDRHSALDVVGPGYFSTLGVPIILGREILETDHASAPKVAVINEAFAKRFFDGRNPIGMRITRITSIGDDNRVIYQVVGVAKNAHTQRPLRDDVEPRYFVPAEQSPASMSSPIFEIRTASGIAPVLVAVRQTIQRLDAALPIIHAQSIEEQMAPLTAQDRTTAQLVLVFGCVALTLAAIGLYGVLSYGIAGRKGEIAIRIAVGAKPSRVIAMILRETMGLVIIGLVAGAGFAYAAARLITNQLYGVAPNDPLTLAVAVGLLLLVALSAAFLPARRASRLDPMVALRQE